MTLASTGEAAAVGHGSQAGQGLVLRAPVMVPPAEPGACSLPPQTWSSAWPGVLHGLSNTCHIYRRAMAHSTLIDGHLECQDHIASSMPDVRICHPQPVLMPRPPPQVGAAVSPAPCSAALPRRALATLQDRHTGGLCRLAAAAGRAWPQAWQQVRGFSGGVQDGEKAAAGGGL